MTTEARWTLKIIRACIAADRFAVTRHFAERMHERGLFWPDILAVINDPSDASSEGMDHYDRPKWIIVGDAVAVGSIEIVCALEVDESETEFITLYWQD